MEDTQGVPGENLDPVRILQHKMKDPSLDALGFLTLANAVDHLLRPKTLLDKLVRIRLTNLLLYGEVI